MCVCACAWFGLPRVCVCICVCVCVCVSFYRPLYRLSLSLAHAHAGLTALHFCSGTLWLEIDTLSPNIQADFLGLDSDFRSEFDIIRFFLEVYVNVELKRYRVAPEQGRSISAACSSSSSSLSCASHFDDDATSSSLSASRFIRQRPTNSHRRSSLSLLASCPRRLPVQE